MHSVKTNIGYIENLRFIALFGVILLHASSPLVTRYAEIERSWWVAANFFDSLSRFCVPVFVMITGALLLGRTVPLKVFLKKRFTRIVLPLVFYTLVFCGYKIYANNGPDTLTVFETAKWVFNQFRYGAFYHFWYVYMILGLYLFIPVLNPWVQHVNKKEIWYFLGIWAATIFFGQAYFKKLSVTIELMYFSGFIGYLVLGHYLHNCLHLPNRKLFWAGFTLFLGGFLTTFFGTHFLYTHLNEIKGTFYGYLTPNVLLQSAGVFMMVKSLSQETYKVIVAVNNIGYGIYFIHALLLIFLAEYLPFLAQLHPGVGIPLKAVICLVLSYAVTFLISNIPKLKPYAG